jgi:hypothetical protein
MNRVDRLQGQPAPARSGVATSRWRYGFDEPRLRAGGHFVPWEQRPQPAVATLRCSRGARFSWGPPASLRGRVCEWLFDRGGMCVVFVAGLVVLGLVGIAIGGR